MVLLLVCRFSQPVGVRRAKCTVADGMRPQAARRMELLPLPEGPKRMVHGANNFMPSATRNGPSLASTRRVWWGSGKLRPPVAAAVDDQQGEE